MGMLLLISIITVVFVVTICICGYIAMYIDNLINTYLYRLARTKRLNKLKKE